MDNNKRIKYGNDLKAPVCYPCYVMNHFPYYSIKSNDSDSDKFEIQNPEAY